MDASAVAALLGALIGAGAAVLGQIMAAKYADRTERRKLAVEAGFREWEQMSKLGAERGGAEVFPPVLFVQFNDDFLRLIDSGRVTADGYRKVIEKREELKAAIRASQPGARR